MPDPRRDQKSLTALRRYLRSPRTIAEIREAFFLCEASAYRWLRYLGDRGAQVVRRGPRGSIRFSVT